MRKSSCQFLSYKPLFLLGFIKLYTGVQAPNYNHKYIYSNIY